MARLYEPRSWYWIVAGEPLPIYDSAAGAFIAADDAGYLAFLAGGNVATEIASASELGEVLERAQSPYLGQSPLAADHSKRPRVRLTADPQTIAHANTDTLDFASAVDPFGMWGGPGNPNRIGVPEGEGGVYDVRINCVYDEGSAASPGLPGIGNRVIGFRQAGTGTLVRAKVSADAEDETAFGVSAELVLEGGVSYRVFARQTCGGDLDVAATLSLRRIE